MLSKANDKKDVRPVITADEIESILKVFFSNSSAVSSRMHRLAPANKPVNEKPKENREGWLNQHGEDEYVMEGDSELSMVMKKHAEGKLITGEIDEEKEDIKPANNSFGSSAPVLKKPTRKHSLYASETVDLFHSTFEAVVVKIEKYGWNKDARKPIEKFLRVEGKHFMDDLKKSRILDSSDEASVAQLLWEKTPEKASCHRMIKASLLNCIFPACYFRP